MNPGRVSSLNPARKPKQLYWIRISYYDSITYE